MPRLLIGASGWTYSSWNGSLCPEDLPSRRYFQEEPDVFACLNNDAEGNAVENARALRRLLVRQGCR